MKTVKDYRSIHLDAKGVEVIHMEHSKSAKSKCQNFVKINQPPPQILNSDSENKMSKFFQKRTTKAVSEVSLKSYNQF